jgi:hypothetical protein
MKPAAGKQLERMFKDRPQVNVRIVEWRTSDDVLADLRRFRLWRRSRATGNFRRRSLQCLDR